MAPASHSIIVLAAGKGTRMRSEQPKVLHEIGRRSLLHHVLAVAQALAPRVRVNGIAPGPTLPSAKQSQERFRQQTENILLRRPPELADFGRTVRYLVENRSITGQVIALDGGQHLGWQTPDIAALNG